ncbi:MAG: AAA family ATPase [Clostridia bacterium]|nr:AAA family ATPase [Clostridia bacterium]
MATNNAQSNIPTLSVGKTVDTLSDIYIKVINAGIPVKTVPSVMMWGAPGVGKSQGVRQIAEKIEKGTGKSVHVTDVRLLLFNPIDLRGIPTANEDKTLAVWLKPQIFKMDESAEVVNILFLDEISAAPQSVQAAAYQITLDRVIGEHKLPENCIVIAAGNRITDKSVAYKMPRALANRLMHFEICADFDSWMKWAVKRGISSKVTGFLSFRRDLFLNESRAEDLAYATPRSWEMVSNLILVAGDDVSSVYHAICGLVGIGTAIEFKSYCDVYRRLPSLDDIFSGRCNDIPKTADVLYALVSSMTEYARKCKDNLTKIASSIDYAFRMPPDFSAVLMKNYMYLEDGYKLKLMKIPAFAKWLSKAGKYL